MGLLQRIPEIETLPQELTELGKVIIEVGKKTGDKLGQDTWEIPKNSGSSRRTT